MIGVKPVPIASEIVPVGEYEGLRLTVLEGGDGSITLSLDALYHTKPPPIPPPEKLRETRKDWIVMGSSAYEIIAYHRGVTQIRCLRVKDGAWEPTGQAIWLGAGVEHVHRAFERFGTMLRSIVLSRSPCTDCLGARFVTYLGDDGVPDFKFCTTCSKPRVKP